MRRTLTILLIAAWLPLVGCGKGGSATDFSRKLDNRIQRDLAKRQSLVAGNPLYLGLVNDLNHGRKLLLSGQAGEAFVVFDRILGNTRYRNFPEYSYAKYYLAHALYNMGVYYGSLLYFVDIVEKEKLKIHTHESLRRSISIAQQLKDDELILYLASSITPDKVPLSLREEFRYFIAKDLYQKGRFKKARGLFRKIPHRNRLYLAAQYLLGTIAVRQNKLRTAIKHFRTISNARSPIRYYESDRIRQLANLALGRVFYERRNYPLAIVYYKKVDRNGEYFPTSLYESAWALFKLHKFNEALAVLHSLNSPFFDQIYFLKSNLLTGAMYLELCHYDNAVSTLSDLEGRFGKLNRQIRSFARRASSPQKYYQLLRSRGKPVDGHAAYRYEDLFKLAAANRDFLGVHRYIQKLDDERELLTTIKSPRANLLAKLLGQKASDLKIKASWLAGKKLKLTRLLIEDFMATKDFIRYEIVRAERKGIQARIGGLAGPVIRDAELIKPEFTDSLRETLVWWDYEGEYWEDELGYYLYDLPGKCKNEGKVRK